MASPSFPDDIHPSSRPLVAFLAFGLTVATLYLLRAVVVPLFLAFLVAYALDPIVQAIAKRGVPRGLAAVLVLFSVIGMLFAFAIYTTPLLIDELRAAAADLPTQWRQFDARLEPWLWQTFKIQLPHTYGEVTKGFGDKFAGSFPSIASAVSSALFGTLSYVGVALTTLLIPLFAIYLLADFDTIVKRAADLVPRRWYPGTADTARLIHKTLGSYVRGQITTNIVLGAFYALGLRLVDVRLAVPIGVFTGMLAFVPYFGFGTGLLAALTMATLDWQGPGKLLGVVGVMGFVQLLDGLVITPRIVGRSVGLNPLEVLLTMMAAGTLFGFLGVLLAVPMGAVVKILIVRSVRAYLKSPFYAEPPPPRERRTSL